MAKGRASEVTLRALAGEPLTDDRVREMVIATAQAIAERQGVNVLDLTTEPDRITVKLDVGRIESIGFAAELRRLTNVWYIKKYGEETLWGNPPKDDSEHGEEWKLA